MDESSRAGESNPNQESIPKVWKCIHCQATVPGMMPGYVPKFCIECGVQQITCINPKCNELLFSDKAERCHACHTPQQPKLKKPQGAGVKQVEAAAGVSDSDTISEPTGGTGNGADNHITTGNKQKETVTDESKVASADNSAPQIQPPAAAQQNTSAAAMNQQENEKEVKDEKTTTPHESPDPQHEQSDAADAHLEISTMISDLDESSDHDEYHSADDKDDGTSVDKLNDSSPVSQIDQPLTRLSLRESRKHGLESGPDSEESNPKKKKTAFGDDKPPLSPTARDSAEKDRSPGESHEKETGRETEEIEKPKGGDQEKSKSGQQGHDKQSQLNVEVHIYRM